MMRDKEKLKREQKEEEGNIMDFINLNYQLNFIWEKKPKICPNLQKRAKLLRNDLFS